MMEHCATSLNWLLEFELSNEISESHVNKVLFSKLSFRCDYSFKLLSFYNSDVFKYNVYISIKLD